MGVAYNSKIVTDGLVLCLDAGNSKSYPGTGTTWTDLSGRGNTGTLTNGPTYSSANGGSIVFDGSNDFVQCTGSLTLTTATFIVWMRRNGNQNQYDGILISRGTNFPECFYKILIILDTHGTAILLVEIIHMTGQVG